jgi:hypothetical protein
MLGFFRRRTRDYVDMVRFRLASRLAFLVNHPDHIDTVLVKRHQGFMKHRFFWDLVRALFGRGLVASKGRSAPPAPSGRSCR